MYIFDKLCDFLYYLAPSVTRKRHKTLSNIKMASHLCSLYHIPFMLPFTHAMR